MRQNLRSLILFCLLCVSGYTELNAVAYEWQAKGDEPSFAIDVPENWRIWESVKRNGIIAQFKHGAARIEVRSFATKEKLSITQLVNQKAARLSSEFTTVRLLEERDSKFKENLHLSVWEIGWHGKKYREETAIVQSDMGPVVVSCFVPTDHYPAYRTHCDNAFYSVSLDVDAKPRDAGVGDSTMSAELYDTLRKFYFVHIPGNLPVIDPDAFFKPADSSPPRGKTQYDENFILPDDKNN